MKNIFRVKAMKISLVSACAARGHRQDRQGAKIAKTFLDMAHYTSLTRIFMGCQRAKSRQMTGALVRHKMMKNGRALRRRTGCYAHAREAAPSPSCRRFHKNFPRNAKIYLIMGYLSLFKKALAILAPWRSWRCPSGARAKTMPIFIAFTRKYYLSSIEFSAALNRAGVLLRKTRKRTATPARGHFSFRKLCV
jgi:hypothetical protein